ncbi:hypothetical protein H6F93_06530 [Leptolyngbya sp. FACHB-671]|uniref:hypothetical protein n=1 Tax=Leptolyngbya sp. FACHB-671 TaxID=2692812 RepID=UPI001688C53B|nr:hypothetical protein [Leptolyngbya sp. FACHB-671]MBD2067186.1 hypothetical protein [Leptolyngbya sp. FACHB-671]
MQLSLPEIQTTKAIAMSSSPSDPVLPIVIVPVDGGKQEEPRREEPPDMRHWQVEEFLRQTGKSENTGRTYRGQLIRRLFFAQESCDTTSKITTSIERSYNFLVKRFPPSSS